MSITPLSMFIRTSDALVKFNAAFQLIRSDEHTVYTLEVQGSELRKLWSKVKSTYDKCLDYLTTLEGASNDDIDAADEKYDSSYRAFVQCLSSINQKLDQIKEIQKSSPLTPANVSLQLETPVRAPPIPQSPTIAPVPPSNAITPSLHESIRSTSSSVFTDNNPPETLSHNLNLPLAILTFSMAIFSLGLRSEIFFRRFI